MTEPAPAISRPAIWMFHEVDAAIITLPASISSSAPSAVVLSPNRCPMAPPGKASSHAGREIQSDQDADIGEADAELARQQRRHRGDALELEGDGAANREQNGENTPAIAHPSLPSTC